MPNHPCPKCGRLLAPSGVMAVEGAEFPVYQCDECISPWTLEGETFECALTFCVGEDGEVFDPAAG